MPETVARRGVRVAALFVALAVQSHALAAWLPGPSEEATPPTPLGRGLLVQLPVQDFDRSIRFYTDLLGFRGHRAQGRPPFVHVDLA